MSNHLHRREFVVGGTLTAVGTALAVPAAAQQGQPIRICTEEEWLIAVGMAAPGVRQCYTATQVAETLGISRANVERWAAAGLPDASAIFIDRTSPLPVSRTISHPGVLSPGSSPSTSHVRVRTATCCVV